MYAESGRALLWRIQQGPQRLSYGRK